MHAYDSLIIVKITNIQSVSIEIKQNVVCDEWLGYTSNYYNPSEFISQLTLQDCAFNWHKDEQIG